MKISDILVREASILDLKSTTKDDLLAEMANALSAAEPALEAAALLGVLREREALRAPGSERAWRFPMGKSRAWIVSWPPSPEVRAASISIRSGVSSYQRDAT